MEFEHLLNEKVLQLVIIFSHSLTYSVIRTIPTTNLVLLYNFIILVHLFLKECCPYFTGLIQEVYIEKFAFSSGITPRTYVTLVSHTCPNGPPKNNELNVK